MVERQFVLVRVGGMRRGLHQQGREIDSSCRGRRPVVRSLAPLHQRGQSLADLLAGPQLVEPDAEDLTLLKRAKDFIQSHLDKL